MDPKLIGVIVMMMCCISSSVSSAMSAGGGDGGDDGGDGDDSSGAGPTTAPDPTPTLRNTPETMRSASTVWSGEAIGVGHGRGRLDSPQAWSAQNNAVGEWYQIDNGVVGKITGVAIKGRKN
jgi:hypothetical protein